MAELAKINVEENEYKFPFIQCGEAVVGNVPSNSYKDINVTFPKPFYGTPKVVVSLFSTSTSYGIGKVSVACYNRKPTGFTARIFNADTGGREPYVDWMAVGDYQ